MALKAAVEPVVLDGLRRRGGTFGVAPQPSDLLLRFEPKELHLVDRRSRKPVFFKQLGRRGNVTAALAALCSAGACDCHVAEAELENEEGSEDSLRVLLTAELRQIFFDVEPETEEAVHVAALVHHWSQLVACVSSGTDGEDDHLPFAAELRQGWWQQQEQNEQRGHQQQQDQQQQQLQQQKNSVNVAVVAGSGQECEGFGGHVGPNPRDVIFSMVLPSDWQLQALQPAGLDCTLFRYQRRCLAWLKWRESLGEGSSISGGTSGGTSGSSSPRGQAAEPGQAAVAPSPSASDEMQTAHPDPGSVKAVLPSGNLLWQPLTLPSGGVVYWNPLEGCVRREPVRAPCPEVSGGILSDEMGLGKTVEMLALFLANPPPHTWCQHPRQAGMQEQLDGGSQEQAAAGTGDAEVAHASGPGSTGAGSPSAKRDNGGEVSSRGSGSNGHSPRGGTLVVCPPALLQQWQSELSNHARGALGVEIYDGLQGLQAALQEEGATKKRRKPAQREAELYARVLAGESIEASYDPAAEVAAALGRLQRADVVLTSFDVLRAEVYFVPSTRSLRQPKKYEVPHCPLLQMHWWRLVVDEAQMVGPLSAAGTMCERIRAVHRWCVTGTPMGTHRGNELSDIAALLKTLQHQPFSDALSWRRLVAEPMAAGGRTAEGAWQLLRSVLRPLMWRNTKTVVAQEFALPHRSLNLTWLTFQPGERAFYEQVVEKVRKAREELFNFRRGLDGADGADEGDTDTSPAVARSRKRGQQDKQGQRLQVAAEDNLTQLRLACIHPQLTKNWRDMADEGQLGLGATLSMEEIMQRLVDQAQFELQEAERNLCAHLNTLAMRLMAKAEGPAGAGSSSGKVRNSPGKQARSSLNAAFARQAREKDGEAAAAMDLNDDDEDEPASPRPAKRARKSRGGVDAPSAEELRGRAVMLLEQSFRVAEKGIAAIDVEMESLKGMPDIEAASTNTVNAWKRLQINTASQLSKLYAASGREEQARKMDVDAQEKVAYLRSQAEMELQSAQQRLEQAQQAADTARHAFRLRFDAAAQLGFVHWGMTGSSNSWLTDLEATYRQAQEEEERELEEQKSTVKSMLGKRVAATLDEIEKRLHGELTQLDRFVSEQHTAAAHRQLLREQHGLAGKLQTAAGSGSEDQVLASAVQALWEVLQVLPDFRRKTLRATHVALFSRQVAEEEERKLEATRRKQEQVVAAKAAAAAAATAVKPEAVTVDMLDGDAGLEGRDAASLEQQQQRRDTEPEAGPALPPPEQQQQQRQDVGPPHKQDDSDGALAGIMQAAEGGQAFVASGRWRGVVPGYVFKLGGSGVGYYRDRPPEVAYLTLEGLHAAATAIGRALQDRQRDLARHAGPEAHLFASLSFDAVEAKLDSVKQQVALVRCLKELHAAERTAAYRAVLQEELDVELADAARLPPMPAGGSVDKLQREVDGLREAAQALLHRMRYMQSRVSEARSLRQGTSRHGQEAQASQQQQQQQEEETEDLVPRQQVAAVEPAPPPSGVQPVDGVGPSSADTVGVGGGDAAAAGSQHGPGGAPGEHYSGMECPVCLSLIPAGSDMHVFSSCGHAFCQDCAAKLVLSQGSCAVCRQRVTAKQVFRVVAGGAAGSNACDPDFHALGGIQPQGEWSAKVEALMRRLLHLATTAPSEKCLVFSQFTDALKMVAMALQTNGIRFVQLLGGKAARRAVSLFRDDDEVRVFLLSHKAGAQGLTLTRASHVFLLEPALEPAIEQQAVARVHRIGQCRPVTVTRLLVKDSIEERVLEVQKAKHGLFAGTDGADEDTAELATTVEAPVQKEKPSQADMEGLLNAM